jgi:hypothetical protein
VGRGCGARTLLSEPARDRAGLGGGVPMFARALREFMLWPAPCTGRTSLFRAADWAGTDGGAAASVSPGAALLMLGTLRGWLLECRRVESQVAGTPEAVQQGYGRCGGAETGGRRASAAADNVRQTAIEVGMALVTDAAGAHYDARNCASAANSFRLYYVTKTHSCIQNF